MDEIRGDFLSKPYSVRCRCNSSMRRTADTENNDGGLRIKEHWYRGTKAPAKDCEAC